MITVIGSNLEVTVMRWLDKRKILYDFQGSSMGDFFKLPENQVALRVQGEFWHSPVGKTGQDIIQRELLESIGWTVVDLYESDLMSRLNETMEKALQGESMLH